MEEKPRKEKKRRTVRHRDQGHEMKQDDERERRDHWMKQSRGGVCKVTRERIKKMNGKGDEEREKSKGREEQEEIPWKMYFSGFYAQHPLRSGLSLDLTRCNYWTSWMHASC